VASALSISHTVGLLTMPQTFTLQAYSIHWTDTQFWKSSVCKQVLSSSLSFIIS